jgi:hypothetical protein
MPGAEGPLLLCDPNGLAERRSNLGLVSTHSSGKYTGGRAVRDTANIEKIRQWTKRPHCIVSGKGQPKPDRKTQRLYRQWNAHNDLYIQTL